MRVSDHLIELFFSGAGTEGERRQVQDFFRKNPERLAEYLTEEGWEQFTADAENGALTPTHQIRQSIESRIGRVPAKRLFLGRVSVAAAIVSLICLITLFRPTAADKDKQTARADNAVAVQAPVTAERAPVLRSIVNGSGKTSAYSLPDGSTVRLAANSLVSFHSPFIDGRRDLFLKGKAVFTVKKDPSMPFAVHCKGIITTALGTVFSVNSRDSLFTTVHLYSGRVVVENEAAHRGKFFKNVYLVPGQRLVVNNELSSIWVETVKPATKASRALAGPVRQPGVLKFDRQCLPDIFSLVEEEYRVKISYDPAILENIGFTGAYDGKTESLESFLNTLCNLNELKLNKTDSSHFFIQAK